MFPDPEMPGVDLVLPDFTYLKENAERVDGLVLTHGHEDHVGGLGYLLRDISTTVYGSALSLGLARNRLEESHAAEGSELVEVHDGERRMIGAFDVEFIPVTHSVPQGFAIAIHSAQGVILHSGDFKLDLTPVDKRRTDLARIGALADSVGIRLVLADSTNAEEPGFTRSERSVGETFRQIFVEHQRRRVVVACFASHIHRIQQVADAAIANGRHVALLGRSMLRNVALSSRARTVVNSGGRAHRGRDRRRTRTGIGLRDLDRIPGRADVGALASRGRREQAVVDRGERRRRAVEPRDPGQ